MKQFFRTIALLLSICYGITSCGDKDDNEPVDNGTPGEVTFNITPIDELNKGTVAINSHANAISHSSLKMNYRSYVSLGQSALGVSTPHYPRVKKMADGNYIMFYHNNQIGASCNYAISQDLRAWSSKGKIFSNYSIIDSEGKPNERRFSTCDALVLSNGDIIAVASYRANSGYKEKPLDAGLAIKRSTNNGAGWSESVEIYQGVNWEPYLLELPSGEIHCYFTDSNRTNIEGTDTGTAMVVSKDNGKTWTPSFGSAPYYVIRTKHQIGGKTYFNNQMPSVIKLNNSNELAAALEAHINGYNISFAYSGEDGKWTHLGADQEGPADRNDSAFPGSAPYLVQFPSGETILSYNRSSIFHLKMGNAQARDFGEAYTPFPGKGYWGSLQLIDEHRLIGTMPNTTENKIMLAQLILNHDIEATRRTVKLDANNSEWANTDHALFVGDRSPTQATLRCSFDNDNVYFLVEALDYSITKSDHATIYISPSTSDNKLSNEACRIKVSYDGLRSTDIYNNSWTSTDLGITASAAYKGSISNNNDQDYGYFVEVAIPRSKLNIKSGEIRVNFSVTEGVDGEDALQYPSSTNIDKWIVVSGL